MNEIAKIAIAAMLGLPVAASAGRPLPGSGQDEDTQEIELASPPVPAVSETQARKIAMTVAKGPISASEYEKEDGAWRWSFDVRENGRIHEIGIDAMTGRIVEDSWETVDQEDEEDQHDND